MGRCDLVTLVSTYSPDKASQGAYFRIQGAEQTVLEPPMSVDLAASRFFASFEGDTVRCAWWGRGPNLVRSCESRCRHVDIRGRRY